MDENVRQFQHLNCDLVELLTGTQPDDLCLLFVQLQAITGHPVTDPRDALRQTIRRIRMVCGWRADVDFCVVGVRVTCTPTLSDNIE